MIEFALRTKTERYLYVEALLSCLDRGNLKAQQACQDILDIGRTGNVLSQSAERSVSTRINGVIAAYWGLRSDGFTKNLSDHIVERARKMPALPSRREVIVRRPGGIQTYELSRRSHVLEELFCCSAQG